MYKKETGNDKQRKDVGNRMLCPYRNCSQAIKNNIKLIEMNSVYFNTTLDGYYQVTVFIFLICREEDSFK